MTCLCRHTPEDHDLEDERWPCDACDCPDWREWRKPEPVEWPF